MKNFSFPKSTIQIALLFLFYLAAVHADDKIPKWKQTLQSLTATEKIALEAYFRTMLENSEGGFVLFGSKPACMEGIMHNPRCTLEWVGGKRHEKSVNLWEGSLVWQRSFAPLRSSRLIISLKDHPDHLYSEWRHLIWINPKKLQDVIKTNLALFQYILGPDVTETKLVNHLQDDSNDVLRDYTLMGIILGFGTQNSLPYHRLECIFRALYSREQPPLKRRHERLQIPDPLKEQYMGFDLKPPFENEPSFSFSTLLQEYQTLCNKKVPSRKVKSEQIPLFAIFNQNDDETNQILKEYETHVSKIQTLLESDSFLETILKEIFE
jgi:hypothetical protein